MVATVCEDLLPDYYVPSMIGCTTDQAVFESLLLERIPDLHAHFIELSIPLTLITIPWLLCIFIGFLSWHATLRVLDCFFYEGRHVLFQIGLSIFQIYREQVLLMDDPVDVIEVLKNSDVNCEQLFHIAFSEFKDIDDHFISARFQQLRPKAVLELMEKLEKRKQTVTLQIPRSGKLRVRRVGSCDPLWSESEASSMVSDSSPLTFKHVKANHSLPTSPEVLARKLNKAKKKVGKLYREADMAFSFRSSSHLPIKFSSAFHPQEEDQTDESPLFSPR